MINRPRPRQKSLVFLEHHIVPGHVRSIGFRKTTRGTLARHSCLAGNIVLRIRRPLVPSGETGLKRSFRNMFGVPNQRHSGTAAIFLETTGYASTIPPPLFLIDSRAACRSLLETPIL